MRTVVRSGSPRRARCAIVAAFLIVVGCTPAGEDRSPAGAAIPGAGAARGAAASLAAIDRLDAQFLDAYQRDDPAAIAALHTDSVRFISEGTLEEGRAALERGWRTSLPALSDLTITTLERVVSGDLAAETIRFTQHYRNQGRLEVDSGYAVSVLQRDSTGQWRYRTHALSRVPPTR